MRRFYSDKSDYQRTLWIFPRNSHWGSESTRNDIQGSPCWRLNYLFFFLCTLLKESWQLILVMVVVSHSWSGGRHNKAVLASCRSPASCYLILYQLWLHVGCHRLPHFHTRGSAAKACWAPLRHHTWHGMSAELNLLALFFFFFLLGSDDAGLPSWPAAATHAWQSLPPFGQVGDLVFIGVVK